MLWLFGYVMFCGSQGDVVSKHLIPDANIEQVLQVSWDLAVLATTYRGMCATVYKGHIREGIFYSSIVLCCCNCGHTSTPLWV
jgi:hypothetical protein